MSPPSSSSLSLSSSSSSSLLPDPLWLILSSIQRQIYNLMKFDSYPRFLKSHVYKECIRCGKLVRWFGDEWDEYERVLCVAWSLCGGHVIIIWIIFSSMNRAEVAGGGGDELNASCYSTVERRREEGGAAQRRWAICPLFMFLWCCCWCLYWSIMDFRLDSLKSKRRKSMSFWENWGGKVGKLKPKFKES